jgi:hypothetical protein
MEFLNECDASAPSLNDLPGSLPVKDVAEVGYKLLLPRHNSYIGVISAIPCIVVIYCANMDHKPNEGICINVFSSYSDVPILWQWNACYFGYHNSGISYAPRSPASLVERCFLSNLTPSTTY